MCYNTHMEIHHLATIQSDTRKYIEFIRTRDLSGGVYRLPSERSIRGARIQKRKSTSSAQAAHASPAAERRLLVPATEPHRFHSITEDLELLVFFAPPEGARAILSSSTI